ncbi:DUF4347 domain-containing protein, partial [Planktothrix sp. FACHB-1365]|uniref:DUF4347 domain-containing protein n=1 Tax=Planktothrix sp. FACHB-1365 TaxID=2692855 RepID=UPI001682A621
MSSNNNFIQNSHQTLVVIDSQVENYETLLQGIDPNAEVVVLDPNQDGIHQITSLLSNFKNIDSLQIIAHGSSGSIQLGNTILDNQTLNQYTAQFQQWQTQLTADADILLYGCNVASGSLGQSFVTNLSQLTGADIAASNDLTGSASLGGNWDLEVNVGSINTSLSVTPEVIDAYSGILAQLDWSLSGIDWPAGTFGPIIFSNIDGSGVDMTMQVTATSGIAWNNSTPKEDNTTFNGGYLTTPSYLYFQIDPVSKSDNVKLTVKLNTPVNYLNFEMYDVDFIDSKVWQDEVVIQGFYESTSVSPQISSAVASPSYTISGNTVTGTAPSDNKGGNAKNGNVIVFFNQPVDKFEITFGDGPLAPNNPASHGIALLSNVRFNNTVNISPALITKAEGSTTTTYEYTVTLDDPSFVPVTVNYNTNDGTATVGNGDYVDNDGTITFLPGETSKTITVIVNGDLIPESNENFTVTLSDPTNAALGSSITATGIIKNDDANNPPVVTDINKTAVDEEQTINFTVTDFTSKFSDVDNDNLTEIQITSLPTGGTLKLNGIDITKDQKIPVAQLDKITFVPNLNFNGDSSFKWNGSDGDKYADNPATVHLKITPVNDPPVVTDISKTADEDTTITFTVADFTDKYTDPENNSLTQIKITSLPTGGTLKLNGVDIKAEDVITLANLDKITFVPTPNSSGDSSFKWKGYDGEKYAVNDATVNLKITPVNDPPVVTDISKTADEDTTITF